VASHQKEGFVVVERAVGVPAKFCERLAKGRKSVGRNLETENVPHCTRIGRVVGTRPWSMSRYELLHFTRSSTPCDLDPLRLRFDDGNARELACRRPGDLAVYQGARQNGKLLECLGDAKLFGSPAG
jgi:hypothetical protein